MERSCAFLGFLLRHSHNPFVLYYKRPIRICSKDGENLRFMDDESSVAVLARLLRWTSGQSMVGSSATGEYVLRDHSQESGATLDGIQVPWPDDVMVWTNAFFWKSDPITRMKRQTIARYLILTETLVLRNVSTRIRKRFPTIESLVQAGIMTEVWRVTMQDTRRRRKSRFRKNPICTIEW